MWLARGSEMHSATSPTQTPSHLPVAQPTVTNEALPSSAEKMLQNTPVQRLKGGNPTTGLPVGRLVTCPRELSITFKPQCKDNRTANLTTN